MMMITPSSALTNNNNADGDVSALNDDQRRAYDIIAGFYAPNAAPDSVSSSAHQSREHDREHDHERLHLIVTGTAGTGKTYLIRCVTRLLGRQLALSATTGVAAFDIGGSTIHSLLCLPVRGVRAAPLSREALRRLQDRFEDVAFVVIDEVSMLGLKTFFWIDSRLTQASGGIDLPFGGFHVLLFGDFSQLPPVGDKPLYSYDLGANASAQQHVARDLFRSFSRVVVLQQLVRQAGVEPTQVLAFGSYSTA
jgi:hypothetical protein